jgi:hypothetical protein
MMISVKCLFEMFVTVEKLFPSTDLEKELSAFRQYQTLFQPTRFDRLTILVRILALPEAYLQWTYEISDYSFVGATHR